MRRDCALQRRAASAAVRGRSAWTDRARLHQLARWVRAALTPTYEGRELVRQMDEVGAKSLPLVMLAGAAIGVVLSLHTRDSFTQFGAESMLPTLIILSMVKETGPIIAALVVSG